MQIVDAQIHLWGSGLPSNLSHRQVTSFTPEEAIALMDEAGVDAAVIHPPSWDPGSDEMVEKLPQQLQDLIARSMILQAKVRRLDVTIHTPSTERAAIGNPLVPQLNRLKAAFEN